MFLLHVFGQLARRQADFAARAAQPNLRLQLGTDLIHQRRRARPLFESAQQVDPLQAVGSARGQL